MTPLRSADLRHAVEFLRSNQVADGNGGYTTEWTTLASAYAEVNGLAGRESVMERVLEGISVYRIRIRWRPNLDIRPSDQARVDGKVLNIRSVNDPDGQNWQLVIMAESASVQKVD